MAARFSEERPQASLQMSSASSRKELKLPSARTAATHAARRGSRKHSITKGAHHPPHERPPDSASDRSGTHR
eukprot:7413356-Pyramimonas_sp.AAC.1